MLNVLIADDSNFMRMSLKKILTQNGHIIVGEANDGKTTIEKYKECSPDVLILDTTMYGMMCIEILEEILKYNENANIVLTSTFGKEAIIEKAIKLGAKGVLLKPFKEESVISAMSYIEAKITKR